MPRKLNLSKTDTGLSQDDDATVKAVMDHIHEKLVALFGEMKRVRDNTDNATARFGCSVAINWAGKRPAFHVKARVPSARVLDSEGVVEDPRQGKLFGD